MGEEIINISAVDPLNVTGFYYQGHECLHIGRTALGLGMAYLGGDKTIRKVALMNAA